MPTLIKPLIPLTFAALLLGGCAGALPGKTITPSAAFKGADAAQGPITPEPVTPEKAEAQKGSAWWLVFADPVLDDLMARAMTGNNDIKLAAAHLEQARALMRQSGAGLWPQAGLSYAPTRSTTLAPGVTEGQSGYPKAGSVHTLDLDLSYEVDVFGRLRKAASAAKLDARSSEALRDDTQLLIQSRVAQSYFALRALDEERAIVSDTLETYRGSLSVTRRRFEEGDVAELDVARLQTEVSSTEAEGLALDQQRANLAHALSILVGEPATTFDVATVSWSQQPWASAVPAIPAGIPSEVLQNRPDVIAADASLKAAQKRVGVARAAWFPSLSLTASGGYASGDLDDLFRNAAKTWSLTGILTEAVFDGGQRRAGVEYAKGGLNAAFASYQQQVLVAFADVEDQLSDLSYLKAQQTAEDEAMSAANRAFDMSQSLYRNGGSSQLEMLDAQRQQLAIRRQALKVRAAQYQSTVGLIRALGGRWSA